MGEFMRKTFLVTGLVGGVSGIALAGIGAAKQNKTAFICGHLTAILSGAVFGWNLVRH